MDYESRIAEPSLRHVADAAADTVFTELYQARSERKVEGPYFIEFSKIDQLPKAERTILETYYRDYANLPQWADCEAMNRGAELFGRYGPQIVVSLFCNALPACYCCAKGAEVLAKTGRMLHKDHSDFKRYTNRVMETAQFIMNVMAPDAMTKGDGVNTILQIRLIHASIRFYLKHAEFDSERFGLPINQQDLVGTLMSFSYISLDTLDKLGVRLRPQQQNDFIHLWNVIAYVLGIEESLIPQSYQQAKLATETILSLEQAPSDSGVLLTKSLVQFIDTVLWRDWFNDFSPFMIRYLSGNERADCLGVADENPMLNRFAVPMMRSVMRCYQLIVRSNPLLSRWVQGHSNRFLQALINYYAEEKQVEFEIPANYRDAWRLKTASVSQD